MSKFAAPSNGSPNHELWLRLSRFWREIYGAEVRTRQNLPGSDKLISRTVSSVQPQRRDSLSLQPQILHIINEALQKKASSAPINKGTQGARPSSRLTRCLKIWFLLILDPSRELK